MISATGECATVLMSLRSAKDKAMDGEGKTRLRTKIAVIRNESMSTDGMFFDRKLKRNVCDARGTLASFLYELESCVIWDIRFRVIGSRTI